MYIPEKSSNEAVPAGTPAIINSWVSLSYAINGLPCFNCAGNPPISGSLGIAFPAPYLALKSTYELTNTLYNVSEGNASCALTFNIKQGKTSLFHHVYPITFSGGNGQYVFFTAGPLSTLAVAGVASVNANVKCNGYSPKIATQIVYFH